MKKPTEHFIDILVEYTCFMLCVAWLLLLFTLTGCGREEANDRSLPSQIHPEFVSLVDEYLREAEARDVLRPGLPFPEAVLWADLPDNILGECTSEGRVYIAYSQRYVGVVRLRATVFHELSHCIFDVGHDPQPGRIMSSNDSYETVFDWPKRVEELFIFIKETSPLLH